MEDLDLRRGGLGPHRLRLREHPRPDQGRATDFNDQGTPFFPDFKDPLACTDLEVVEFEPSTATASRFRVMFKDKKWVIPSHYNYPADAKDRLSKTAAAVMDLTKDTIRSTVAKTRRRWV